MFCKGHPFFNQILQRRNSVTLAEQMREIEFVYIQSFAKLIDGGNGCIIVVQIPFDFGISFAAFHGARCIFRQSENIGYYNIV